jgi:hypothetical protein
LVYSYHRSGAFPVPDLWRALLSDRHARGVA